ncbi:MAG: HD-GYP domain-containing protein [Spirochaetaceae bacterium]|nr:HD-GYP domain-containing protein [Spirochaetaceae bacterium]
MKELDIKSLKPDIYYSSPVFIDKEYILTTPDMPLSSNIIEKLKKWQFSRIYTDGHESAKPVVPVEQAGIQATNLNEDLTVVEVKKETQVFFRELCGFLENTFENYKTREMINYNFIVEHIKKINPFIKEKRDFILDMSNLKVTEHNYLISHSVKTAILSIALAEFLKLPQHKIIELGAAAMTHKIGMLKLPESIVKNPGGLKENEWNAIKAYPILGYKILQTAAFPNAVCIAVLEHQERNNGTGYPRKQVGDQISLYGKILAVISSYCAAIEKRPFKSGKDAHTGIMEILKSMGKQYDVKVVQALIYTLSLYPIGTKVLLSNNSVAVVIKTNALNPNQPIIRVLTSEEGAPIKDNVVMDLSQNTKIKISRLLTQSEILKLVPM